MRISDWSSDVCSSDLEVPERLTSELIVAKARLVARGLRRDFGIDTPRIALAGLHPHAGENGQLGDEEERVMNPAGTQLAAERTPVDAPGAADAPLRPGLASRSKWPFFSLPHKA